MLIFFININLTLRKVNSILNLPFHSVYCINAVYSERMEQGEEGAYKFNALIDLSSLTVNHICCSV